MFGFSPLASTQAVSHGGGSSSSSSSSGGGGGFQKAAAATSAAAYSSPLGTKMTLGPPLPPPPPPPPGYEKRLPKRQINEASRQKKIQNSKKRTKDPRSVMDLIADMLSPITSLITSG